MFGMKFLSGLSEVFAVIAVLLVAVALPVCLAWGLIVLVRETFGSGWLLVLAQIAAGFIGIFGIPLTLGAIGYVGQRIKKD
jgi:hypothetical protein